MGCMLKGNSGLYARMTVGAVLLAAGSGSRLGGRPKALLELGGHLEIEPLQVEALIAVLVEDVERRLRPEAGVR